MATGSRRGAAGYDEIVRHTVPEPDLSFRPSREEQRLSRHRFGEATEHRPHPMTPAERRLLARVIDALISESTLDITDVEIQIEGQTVVLFGSVPGPSTAIRIEDIAGSVEGVSRVDNELVVRSPRR